ncbi:MCA1 [Symbiodinium pilosum]|uniref:MCA1 protein n=1 Tax=Symbiodinium pilosum TaxID=2952 RepID=A0A812YK90_SYMPI|nr:MCA1 [Symbiodinium pilosum]
MQKLVAVELVSSRQHIPVQGVGCNYPSKAFGLAGAVNDAFLIAETLQAHLGFRHENVCVLHDVYPGQKKSLKVEPAKCPTRVNILHQLHQMVRATNPGDLLFFSFSGYGLQVDDMDGYADEGLEEAILPTDFVDGRDGDYSVICTNDLHDVLLGIPANAIVMAVMDCDHATTLIDVSGTIDGSLISGLKFSDFCGLKAHSSKMNLASHNRDVWQEEKARSFKARPRFQPVMEIENPRKGRLPTRPAMSRSSAIAFCYAAAGHGQTAMEMQMTMPGTDGQDQITKQHGVLSWCFTKALEALNWSCSYFELWEEIRRQMAVVQKNGLPRMDQEVLLTFSPPLSKPRTMKAFQPIDTEQEEQSALNQSMRIAAPAVVPPPPPGFITGSGSNGAGCSSSRPPSDDFPPPAQPARTPQRCMSELVHHNVEGREGSFRVHGTSYAPQPRPEAYHQPPPSRDHSAPDVFGIPPTVPVYRQERHLPPPPPPFQSSTSAPSAPTPHLLPSPVESRPTADVAGWPSPQSPVQRRYPGQAPIEQPGVVKGLTPPNLFGGGGLPSLSFNVPGYGTLAPKAKESQPPARMPWTAPLFSK